MGPTRHPHEPLSHYRFRVAGYSFKWLMALGLALALVRLVAPPLHQAALPGLLMFLYIGLPLGIGMALLASLGSWLLGLWSSMSERSVEDARRMKRIKLTTLALLLSPGLAFGLYQCGSALLAGKVLALSKADPRIITWAEQPTFFAVSTAFWVVASGALLRGLGRQLKAAWMN